MADEQFEYGRCHSRREEIANAVSHGLGLLAALIGTPFLLSAALQRGDLHDTIAAVVFAIALILQYLSSTLYHALPDGRAKQCFHLLDHCAIFLLIAGTYTPFTLGVLRGAWGWTLFVLVWAMALGGILMKVYGALRHPVLYRGLYLCMGWLVLVAVQPLWASLPTAGLLWLAGGSLAYTLGIVFHMAENLRFSHVVWHLFVVVGSGCHYIAVLWYAPYSALNVAVQ